ncbi:MAG: hypothetical protein HQM12_16575 [SAR324 cluster bacterium]|nr:hypothetical protein [SAR324 cluster bacterium]MBF0352099.1 hypothetical protein [SAR324 cluster bacterium]
MTLKFVILLGGWILLSGLVGFYGRKSKIGFLGIFLLSLVLTPPLMAFFFYLFQPKKSGQQLTISQQD